MLPVRVMRKKLTFFLFYSSDIWALDVIRMIGNLELYQTFFRILDSQWAAPWCSCMDLQLWR
jgi:hypothetical protein